MKTSAGTYRYTYDAVGNITSVSLDDKYTNTYVYDELNQLVRENNQQTGKTYTYSYRNGNIVELIEYDYTAGKLGEMVNGKICFYDDDIWSDLLTNFNGTAITYDTIGNPLTMGSKTLSWMGRQLEGITDGDNNYSYAYNMDGQRVSKTVNGTKTEFFYNGNILTGQKTGNDSLVFMYDNSGDPFAFTYNGSEYFYVKNAQNDITGIIDSSTRTLIAMYNYDAWGNIISVTDAEGNVIDDMSHIAHINPLRYRSYYYDSETNFYYLNSRYYSPEMCRFINADNEISGTSTIQGYNLFSYCFNNPVNMSDSSGNWPKWIKKSADWVKNKFKSVIVQPIKKALNKALSVHHDVPLYNQGNAPLCWAYCQTMGEAYKQKRNWTQQEADRRAREIAIAVHGEDNWQQAGVPQNLGEQISVDSITSLAISLRIHGPLYARYKNVNDFSDGHLVVVTGVDLNNGKIFTNNPWGINGEQTFTEFQNGFAGLDNGSYTLDRIYIME